MSAENRYTFLDAEARWQRVWADRAALATPAAADAASKRYIYVGPHPAGGRAPSGASRPAAAPLPSAGAPDLSTARAWVLGDAFSRFERHRGRVPAIAPVIDGFSPAALIQARSRGMTVPSVVEDEAESVLRLLRALGVRHTAGPLITSDREYYRITQWIFLQLFGKGLAVRREEERCVCSACGSDFRKGSMSACPRCKGALTDTVITRWSADLTPYGDRLLGDLEKVDWSVECRAHQRTLLARCRGSEVTFPVSRMFELEYGDITVFTTSIEAIFGVTFIAVDPHHPVLEEVTDPAYEEDLVRYRERLRKGAEPAISGVRTGGFALNPANMKRIPIVATPLANEPWSDGAVMAVPAHHVGFFELAKRLKLAIREVIHNDKAKLDANTRLEEPWLGDGVLTNSGSFTSLPLKVGRDRIIAMLSKKGVCQKGTRYKLRSLPLSSPIGWGAPVPIIHCKRCGPVPVPESELPLELPAAAGAAPEAGLAGYRDFVKVRCHRCNALAARDTDTILPWVGEAWSVIAVIAPELAERLEGFRDLSPAVPAPTAMDAATSLPDTPDTSPFPEDVDVFGPGEEIAAFEATAEGEEGDEGPGDAAPPDGGEVSPGVESGAETAESGAPREPEATGQAPIEASTPGPSPGEMQQAGRRGKDAKGARDDVPGKGRGGRRAPSDEPETITPQTLTAEEEEGQDGLAEVSALRPFPRDRVEALLPADLCLGRTTRTRDIIGMRYVMKVLHDLGHHSVEEPFLRYRQVADALAAAPAARPGPAPSPPPGAPLFWAGRFGADALRLHLLFAGPSGKPITVDERGLIRMRRFIDRIWKQMALRRERGKFVSRRMLVEKHRLIHEVTERASGFKLHTAIASLMRFVRFLEEPETTPEDMDRQAMRTFLVLLEPFAPHLAEELWHLMGAEGTLAEASWPVASDELIHPPEREFAIFVDGKVRDRMVQPSQLESEKLESRALQRERIREIVANRRVKRVVVVPQKLVAIALEQ
jgi:leucyl-tRNA synthetase